MTKKRESLERCHSGTTLNMWNSLSRRLQKQMFLSRRVICCVGKARQQLLQCSQRIRPGNVGAPSFCWSCGEAVVFHLIRARSAKIGVFFEGLGLSAQAPMAVMILSDITHWILDKICSSDGHWADSYVDVFIELEATTDRQISLVFWHTNWSAIEPESPQLSNYWSKSQAEK